MEDLKKKEMEKVDKDTKEGNKKESMEKKSMSLSMERKSMCSSSKKLTVVWFRHGLRLHDNASLSLSVSECLSKDTELMLLYVFDGHTSGTQLCSFNRLQFLTECLQDLDTQLHDSKKSRLHVCRSKHVLDVLRALHVRRGIEGVYFEQDCEPIWKSRDSSVKKWCDRKGIKCVESIGHTLWDPHEVIEVNGGSPPTTFSMFEYVLEAIGRPQRPLEDVDLTQVTMANISQDIKLADKMGLLDSVPSPSFFGVVATNNENKVYVGGERRALKALDARLDHELNAFRMGHYLPNHSQPNILCPPKSLSPDLRFGCLSVRKFYWGLIDAFKSTQKGTNKPFNPRIVAQLVWREFFYTMSVNNAYFDEMERNPICISIPWRSIDVEKDEHFKAFRQARTGFPFIDAGMRQLYKEGWIHHIVRNAIACFLTRGDLWISWEHGLRVFLEFLLDADWSVCAGNWMWISSSAFEHVLNCSTCVDPCVYGQRTDPSGDYVRKYVPELAHFGTEYIYQPWKAPLAVQRKANCIIGDDYPKPIVDHEKASKLNTDKMENLKNELLLRAHEIPRHCAPSNERETRAFMSFPASCVHNTNGSKGSNCSCRA